MSTYESVKYYNTDVRVDGINCNIEYQPGQREKYETESRRIIACTADKHRDYQKKIDATK